MNATGAPTKHVLWRMSDMPSCDVPLTKLMPDFLDYYFQLVGYLKNRKERRALFGADTDAREVMNFLSRYTSLLITHPYKLTSEQYAAEYKSYCGRERVLLRKRRAKLRVEQFHIIAQVGQGGYGEVYLARKNETGEVCALKKMKKRTLFKMDEASERIALNRQSS